MKKNKMMRLASGLLVATLLTTSMISGTFAKYVTSDSSTDVARVAKWGVTVTANGSIFANAYETDDAGYTETESVFSTDKVVAPGTDGTMVSMELTGTPEVAVKVNYEADFALSDNWTVEGGDFYCPLKINVEDTVVNGLNYINNKAGFEEAVEYLINDWSKAYSAGTDLSTVGTDSVSVSWEWPFSTSDENDVKDTWLGNQAADGDHATVALTIKTTVTQID